MKLLDFKDFTAEQLKSFSQPGELTSEAKAEVARLYWSTVTDEDLKQYEDWANATPVDDFLRELKEEQRLWDAQHR